MFKRKGNNDKKILKEKLLRIEFSDPAINAKKNVSKMIDLSKCIDNSTLYNFLWSDSNELPLSDNSVINDLIEELHDVISVDQLCHFCEDHDINYEIDDSESLSNLTSAIEKQLKKESVGVNKIIKNIKNEAKKILLNENIYTLYVAAYFINGLDINNKAINAPLLLWEVEIKEVSGSYVLKKTNDNPTINEKFNFYLKHEYATDIDFDSDTFNQSSLQKYEVALNKILSEKIIWSKTINPFENGLNQKLALKSSCCLMLIEPMGGSIKKNIEVIEKSHIETFPINTKTSLNNEYEQNVIKNDDIIEINRKLNIYQKYAIESSLNENTLIYGPPGTGKSETICSLIANCIRNKKTILISSEKQAALDVLENRMQELNQLCLIGYKTNKNEFYEHILNFEKLLRQIWKEQNLKTANKEYEDIKELNDEINNFFKKNKNYSFNEFTYLASQIDINYYIELKNYGFFDAVDELFKKQNLTSEKDVYQFFLKFKEQTYSHIDSLNFMLSHTSFDSYDAKFLSKFIKEYNASSKEDFILSSLINNNRIKTKERFFKTRKLIVDIDHNAIIALLEEFVKLGLNNISRKTINSLAKIELDEQLFCCFVKYHELLEQIPNKYFKLPTINTLSNQYQAVRNNLCQTTAKNIVNNYFAHIVRKIEKMSDEDKSKFFLVFSKCNAKVKPAINVFIKNFYEELKFFFPIWIMSPEQVSIVCPVVHRIFDYGIFDEASQMFLEKAYPLVFRCKNNIVAGDDKQLQPSSFFLKQIEMDENAKTNDTSESLFEMANVCMWTKFYLKNHYRSQSADLICFSNKYFYENQLEFSTYNYANRNALEVHNVNGIWKNNHNLIEINKIIELLKQNQKEYEASDKKILLITFNIVQEQHLKNCFVKTFANSRLYEKYEAGQIVFRALENVQGDEADIVYLSISYAKSSDNTFRQFFGPLSQQHGANRLNVAITRAKEKMIVVKSIMHDDIKVSNNENNNIFKNFINFLDQNDKSYNTNLILSQQEIELKNFYLSSIVNFIENSVDKIQYDVVTNKIIGKKILDVAIVDKINNTIAFGLIINTNDKSTDLKNVIQQIDEVQFLKDLKYNIYYMNLIDWYIKNDQIRQEITQAIFM